MKRKDREESEGYQESNEIQEPLLKKKKISKLSELFPEFYFVFVVTCASREYLRHIYSPTQCVIPKYRKSLHLEEIQRFESSKDFFDNFIKSVLKYSIYRGNIQYFETSIVDHPINSVKEIFTIIKGFKPSNDEEISINVIIRNQRDNLSDFLKTLGKEIHFYQKNIHKLNGENLAVWINKILFDFAFENNKIEGSTLTKKDSKELIKEINKSKISHEEFEEDDKISHNSEEKEKFEQISPNSKEKLKEENFKKEMKESYYQMKIFLMDSFEKKDIFQNCSFTSFTNELILRIHKEILYNLKKESIGTYRKCEVKVGEHIPPHFKEVPKKMNDLITWVHQQNERLDVISVVAEFHYKFEDIHPFRVGRVLANLLLLLKNYPIFSIPVDVKNFYIQGIVNISKRNNFSLLTRMIAEGCYKTVILLKRVLKDGHF